MILYATQLIDFDISQHVAAATMVKVKAITSLRQVAEDAVQLHGAIGLTSELKLSRYFNRIMFIEGVFGTPDSHLDHYLKV
jgi:alkylation response protein AidB-like acyl-CoA dehydrogenase